MSLPRRRPRLSLATSLLSVALAAVVGMTVYLATTSLPYLALTPTTDPTFGALNECLRRAVPSRAGFAVGHGAQTVAAWSGDRVAVCASDAGARTWPVPGVNLLAFDELGEPWAATSPGDGGAAGLRRLGADGGVANAGELTAQALVGTAHGVVALEAPGRLLALGRDGQVRAVRELPPLGTVELTASADGQQLAVTGGGGYLLLDAAELTVLRRESPCAVEHLWWRPAGHQVVVTCGPEGAWALEVDADTGEQQARDGRTRVPSVLAAGSSVYVQACDVLPCTAPPPE